MNEFDPNRFNDYDEWYCEEYTMQVKPRNIGKILDYVRYAVALVIVLVGIFSI